MTAHYRQRRISEILLCYRPADLPGGKHGVRNIETGQVLDGLSYDTEDLARTKCRMLAAAEIERLYLGDRAAAIQRIQNILGEQSDPAWAAKLICDYFEGARA